jgi:Flp pilus assembly pilin Flp
VSDGAGSVPLESLAEPAGERIVLWSRVMLWRRVVRGFVRDEDGLETIEWSIMGALIIVLCAITINAIGLKIWLAFLELQLEVLQ